jgi:hypothetical protein
MSEKTFTRMAANCPGAADRRRLAQVAARKMKTMEPSMRRGNGDE